MPGLFPLGAAHAEDLPPEVYISGFNGHPQTHNLSCESRSASDWAAFWGVSASEDEILQRLGLSDNPEVGFVGNVNGLWGNIPPNAYGTHAAAIARVLREFGLPAQERKGMSWDEARAELAAGRPVIVWIIGAMWAGTPVSYTAQDGQTLVVARYEHTMTLIGYSPNLVHAVDASSGWANTYSLDSFLTSWSVLENQAVVASGQPSRSEPRVAVPSAESYTVQSGDYLMALALQFGVTWQDLAALNEIPYPYRIYAGQVLKIPGKEPPPAPLTTPTPEPQAAPKATEHIVQPGEYLTALAKQYGTTWRELVDLNEIRYPYFIYPGQVLALPAREEGQAAPPSAPQATSEPTVEPTLEPTPEPASGSYVVQPGEYLTELARRFNVDWMTLAEFNDIQPPYTIYPDQVLKLP